HATEALLDHLLPEPVEDLLVEAAGFVAAPLVLGELFDRPRGRTREVVEGGFGEAGVVVVAARERVAFGGDRLIGQLWGAAPRAVELPGAERVAAHAASPGLESVEAASPGRASPQQVAQRFTQAASGEHVPSDLVDGGAHVVGRGERVRAALPRAVT